MHKRSSRIKPEFKVEYIPTVTRYDPILDSNLEYYFASRQNRRVLRKNRIINGKNEIIDRNITKIVRSGQVSLNNSFKMPGPRKFRGRTIEMKQRRKNSSEKVRPSTVDRHEFLDYI